MQPQRIINGIPNGQASQTNERHVERAVQYWRQARVGHVLDTKREADEWQAQRKLELKAVGSGRGGEIKTLGDALCKFRDEVSPEHKGERWEALRIGAMLRHPALPCALPLARLLPDHIIGWRHARLQEVSAGSVLRDMNLLGSILGHAVREWRWIARSPMTKVSRPSSPRHRDRVIRRHEIQVELLRPPEEASVFLLAPGARNTFYRCARNRARLSGFTFYDARHTAATWIGATVGQPRKLSFPEFVKVFGWRDPKNAMIYVNPSAESLAEKL
jgi:hypothetical protein